MKIKFDHINISVHRLKESIQWYTEIFGFKLVEQGVSNKPWAIVVYDDYMICMGENRELNKAHHYTENKSHAVGHFGIRVSDDKVWEQKIKKFDLELYYGGVSEHPHSKSWYVRDPSGHSIEVSYSGNKPLKFPDL